MAPIATDTMPMRTSNCQVLRASWCRGPSKTVFSLVVIPISLVTIIVKKMSVETQFGIGYGYREQCRAETADVRCAVGVMEHLRDRLCRRKTRTHRKLVG